MELRFDRLVGRGAFADVWLALDETDRQVAVKFFNDTTPSAAERTALQHAEALLRVDSPAVVRVHALEPQPHPDTNATCLALVMEYVPGPSLSLHRGALPGPLALRILQDLATGVNAIHGAGLVHGDLHDGNVLITDGGAKLVDILYTHSLAAVGTRTATQTRADDMRALAVLMRQIVQKADDNSRRLAEVFYQATTTEKTPDELQAMFSHVLALHSTALALTPTDLTTGSFETHVERMTESDFGALLASVDDDADHHVLWVTIDGHARITPVGADPPQGFSEQHRSEMQFRWETFACGNGWCGHDAARDTHYVRSKLSELKNDWRQGKTGYVDY